MMRIEWKRTAMWIVVAATAATLSRPILGAPTAVEQGGGSAAAGAGGTPLYLPDHHYDLPATHISAAQIQAHKLKMLRFQGAE